MTNSRRPPSPSNSVILVPVYKDCEPETRESLYWLDNAGWRVEFRHGGSAIDGQRSTMATWAIQHGFEWLFWVDSDIHFAPTDFMALVETEGDFVCAPYMRKTPMGTLALLEVGGEEVAAGFGFMKTHRDIYHANPCKQSPEGPILFPYFRPQVWDMPWGPAYYAEDYSFCLRAREHGHRLKVNHDIKIGHIGRYCYRYDVDGAQPIPTAELQLRLGQGTVTNAGQVLRDEP